MMEPLPEASVLKHSSKVKDPQVEYLVEHKLIDILIIAVCAVIARRAFPCYHILDEVRPMVYNRQR